MLGDVFIMKEINRKNISNFMNYYHNFHDSNIININYIVKDTRIEIVLDVCWSGIPVLNEDKTYQTNSVMLKIIFYDIVQYNNREMFFNKNINKAFLKYIKFNDKEMLCFADSSLEPLFYVVCDRIEYEEIDML